MVASVKLGWPGIAVTMVSMCVPPLNDPHRSHLGEAGLLPNKAASLIKLGAVLEVLDPQQELVLILSGLNAPTAMLAPTVEGKPPHMSFESVLNTCGHVFLSLVTQKGLLLLSGTMQLSH